MIGWRSFTHGTRTLVVKAAEMVFTKGASFARPIAVLDERELQDTLRKAEDALKTPGVLPPGTLDKVAQVVLT